MDRHTLSFSIVNLITVWIMLALGFFFVALATQAVTKWKKGAGSSSSFGAGSTYTEGA